MGLTERHWFENDDVPENYEWALEDAANAAKLKKQAEEIRELREALIELSTNGGTGNQREVCLYLLNLMDVIEERQRRADNGCPNRY